MSTIAAPAPAVTAATAPSLLTLTRVEFRKLLDTRGLVGTLAVAALLAGATGGGETLRRTATTFGDVAGMALLFGPYFLMALGALLVTSEQRHRTSSTAFALVPRRGRVLAAKAVAIVVLALVAAGLGLLAGTLISAVVPALGIASVSWSFDAGTFAVLVLGLVAAALIGWAMGMATGSLAIALAAYLIWPMVSSLIGSVSPEAAHVLAWLRPEALYTLRDGLTSTTLGQTATSLALWIVLPAVIGWMRLTKGEVR